MKRFAVLLTVILLAGCVGGGNGSSNTPDKTTNEVPSFNDLPAKVRVKNLPETISSESNEYFEIEVVAGEDIDEVSIRLYNLGSYLTSPCQGLTKVQDVEGGETKSISCSITVTDEPLDDFKQEIMYNSVYSVAERQGQVGVKVYDESEYLKAGPSDSIELGVGKLELDSTGVKEGGVVQLSFVTDSELATEARCGCSIEKAVLKLPVGFEPRGLSGWSKSRCGSFVCYEKRNIDSLEESFELSVSGVINTETYYIGAELQGIWFESEGSTKIQVLME